MNPSSAFLADATYTMKTMEPPTQAYFQMEKYF